MTQRIGRVSAIIIVATMAPAAEGQTQVDLRTQSRNIDFSGATRTKPFKTGTALPSSCSVGETYFKTDAAPGQNLYTCTSSNTWTPTASVSTSNSGPGAAELLKTLTGSTITARQLLAGEGAVLTQQTDTVTAEVDTAVVPRYTVSSSAPTGACQSGGELFTRTGGFPNFYTCVGGEWKPAWTVADTIPVVCHVGELLYHTTQKAIYGCTAVDTWTRLTNAGGVDLTANGECFISTGCTPAAGSTRGALTTAATNGQWAAVRITIRDRVKLGKGLIYASGGSSTAAFTAAIYADNDGAPGSKIAGTDVRFVDLSFAALRQATWGTGDVVLTPGLYWLGFSSQDPAAEFYLAGGLFASIPKLMASVGTKPGAMKCSSLAIGAGADYELPATCGTATAWTDAGDMPIIVSAAQ